MCLERDLHPNAHLLHHHAVSPVPLRAFWSRAKISIRSSLSPFLRSFLLPAGCPNGSIYHSCGSPCAVPTCLEPYPQCPYDLSGACLPADCQCPSGQVWHDGACIARDRCPVPGQFGRYFDPFIYFSSSSFLFPAFACRLVRCCVRPSIFDFSVDCIVSEWAATESCSVTCGTGLRRETRTVLQPALDGGKACPVLSRYANCNLGDCIVCADGLS